MAKTRHIKSVIQLRRATENQWIEANPVLYLGEPAYSTDVYKLKIGDGVSTWIELPYLDEELIAGNGIVINEKVISLDDLIIDCGTSEV